MSDLTIASPSAPLVAANTGPQVSSEQSSGVDRAKQQAALAKLLQTYQNDLKHGQTASSLKSLAKQITDAGKALGQHVTLPTAPAGPDGSTVTSTTATRVSVTA